MPRWIEIKLNFMWEMKKIVANIVRACACSLVRHELATEVRLCTRPRACGLIQSREWLIKIITLLSKEKNSSKELNELKKIILGRS